MLRVILKTFFGIPTIVSGFYVAYLYLKTAEDNGNLLLLGLSLVLIAFGVFLLVSAGKSNDTIAMAPDKDAANLPQAQGPGLEDILKHNEEMVSAWGDTVSKRDKLKLLEISSTAEESSSS